MTEFKAKGWFEISPYKDMSRLVFSREPLRQGLFTCHGEKREGRAKYIVFFERKSLKNV